MICYDSTSIAPAASTRVTALLTTCERVLVKACCAPMTSVFNRETSDPVWSAGEEGHRLTLHVVEHLRAQVVDQALPHPRRCPAADQSQCGVEDRQPGHGQCSKTTTSRFPGVTPESMTDFSSNGTAAALAAAITVVTRKTEMPPVRSRVLQDPPGRALRQPLVGHAAVA